MPMSSTLPSLEPRALWRHFQALSAIPRGSGQEKAVQAHILAFARERGLEAEQDAVGNVLVRKPASSGREAAPGVALQAHVDMVCEKRPEVPHDFDRDPIRLVAVDGWIRAEGTTLGADNGIGVAAALAVLEAEDLAHGPLECLFTVDEERGLTGAQGCREGWLKAQCLLNLDGEDARQLTISCAGGLETVGITDVTRVAVTAGWRPFRLAVGGLQGGHSGVDIHLGRGNALKCLGLALQDLLTLEGVGLASLRGGSRRNVIPREAEASLWVAPAALAALEERVTALDAAFREALGAFDPAVQVQLSPAEGVAPVVLVSGDARRVVDLLAVLPHGVQAMSPAVPGLVQTSTNLAVVTQEGDRLTVVLSHRSANAWEKHRAGKAAVVLLQAFGFKATQDGDYPGWAPEVDTRLVSLAQATGQDLLGEPMTLRAIHAGLECGILGGRHPGLEMISFGPDILDAHSPQERVEVASVARFWTFLTALLARI